MARTSVELVCSYSDCKVYVWILKKSSYSLSLKYKEPSHCETKFVIVKKGKHLLSATSSTAGNYVSG